MRNTHDFCHWLNGYLCALGEKKIDIDQKELIKKNLASALYFYDSSIAKEAILSREFCAQSSFNLPGPEVGKQ